MISKHRFYLMWTIAIAVLMVVGTCNVAKADFNIKIKRSTLYAPARAG